MAAEYDFRRKPDEKGNGELQPFYPRIVSKGTIDSKQLFREIAEASSFTEGDLEGIMVSLQNKVSYYLSEGFHVKFLFEPDSPSGDGKERNPFCFHLVRQCEFQSDKVVSPPLRRNSDPCKVWISRILKLAGRDTFRTIGYLFEEELLHHPQRIQSNNGVIERKSTA